MAKPRTNPVANSTEENCPLAKILAARLRDDRRALTARWLERIAARVALDPGKLFPTDDLLDHVPLLIDGIAEYLENPAKEVRADMPVVAKAMELGELRHTQGFDVYQILKEYEILGGILFTHLADAADSIPDPCAKSELLYCGQRLFKAVTLIQQATTMHYLRLSDQKVADREERLRAFNRSVSHEIKNRIGTILGASVTLLEMPDIDAEQRLVFVSMIAKNARSMQHTVENLVELSRTEKDARQHRNVLLPQAAQEAARQIRELSASASVEIRLADLPAIEVNAAAVELCLTNYLSNSIKYADSSKASFAEISAAIETGERGVSEIVIRVRDNGVGVPPEKRKHLFQRFYRALDAATTHTDGTGLGLSIVAETAQSLGGRAWAEFPPNETIFAFSMPCRRAEHRGQKEDPPDRDPVAAPRARVV